MICFIYSQVQYIYHAENDKVSLMLYFTLLKNDIFFQRACLKVKRCSYIKCQYFLLNDSEEILKWQIYELSQMVNKLSNFQNLHFYIKVTP